MKATRTKHKRNGNLPAGLKAFFWDYEFHRLSWDEDREVVIALLLPHGDCLVAAWLPFRTSPA